MRLWYLQRAVPWAALLGCLLGAAVMSALTHRWPSMGWLAMPAIALLCAASAAFLRDEPAVAVVSVTPRGGAWATGVRTACALVPLGMSLVLLATLPSELDLDPAGSSLVAAATVLVALGSASWAARRQLPRPGGAIASAIVLVGLAPLPVSALLGWASVFPFGPFPDGVRGLWIAVAAAGVLLWLVAVTQPPRIGSRR